MGGAEEEDQRRPKSGCPSSDPPLEVDEQEHGAEQEQEDRDGVEGERRLHPEDGQADLVDGGDSDDQVFVERFEERVHAPAPPPDQQLPFVADEGEPGDVGEEQRCGPGKGREQ